jgi:hypothetical protein
LFTVGVSTKTQPQLLDAYPVGCDAKWIPWKVLKNI